MAKYADRSTATETHRETKKEGIENVIKEKERRYYHENNRSCQRGEWGIVRAVVAENRNERDATVESRADADPGQNHFENREINVP